MINVRKRHDAIGYSRNVVGRRDGRICPIRLDAKVRNCRGYPPDAGFHLALTGDEITRLRSRNNNRPLPISGGFESFRPPCSRVNLRTTRLVAVRIYSTVYRYYAYRANHSIRLFDRQKRVHATLSLLRRRSRATFRYSRHFRQRFAGRVQFVRFTIVSRAPKHFGTLMCL